MWLKVDQPCDADWDQMGDGAVRHCRRCRKDVYDLSSLTTDEAQRLAAAGGCARFQRRQDGSVVTRDAPAWLALGAALLAAGTAHADLSSRPGARRTKLVEKPRVEKPPDELREKRQKPPDELREHVPHAPGEQAAVMGEISLSAVRLPVQAIQRCYQKQLHARLAGKLVLKLTIKNGRADKVAIGESTLDDQELEACVLEAVREWKFPEAAETITISYPLIFNPGP